MIDCVQDDIPQVNADENARSTHPYVLLTSQTFEKNSGRAVILILPNSAQASEES